MSENTWDTMQEMVSFTPVRSQISVQTQSNAVSSEAELEQIIRFLAPDRRGKLRRAFARQRIRFLLILLHINGRMYTIGKRTLDLTISLFLLPVLLPFMALVALAIRLDSSGPVIFRQPRVGKWGKEFTCYKFRSMYTDAEARKAQLIAENEADEIVFKIRQDPRVTRVGRIIRKTSIDELPQVFNVIRGEMSLVGPRPPVPSEVVQYSFDHHRRLDAVPGMTGLQQISGRSELPFQRWVELDVTYIDHQSLREDVRILLKTIPTVISGKGAY